MAYFKVTSFLCIFLLIHYSLAVLNNLGCKNENVDVKRTLCAGGDIVHGNDEILAPIVVDTESVSSAKVNKITGTIEDRASSIPREYELPLSSYNNPVPIYSPSKSFYSLDLQLPEVFLPQSQSLHSFPQFGNSINTKRLQYTSHYAPAFLSHNNRIKSVNIRPIPTSLEAYGPPINKPVSYFSSSSASSSTLLSKEHHGVPAPHQIQNNIHADILTNVGILAPPTPPDIKYDGWKPIPGHISPPNYPSGPEQSTNIHTISSLSTDNNFAQLSGNEVEHSSRQLSDFPTAIPSNSYGEPINNPEDHNLKHSVRQSHISDGLPPQQIPENEPFHVNQGPTTMIFSTNSPSAPNTANNDNNNNNNNHNHNSNNHNGLESLTLPNIDIGDDLPGLFRPEPSGNEFKHNNNNNNNNGFLSDNDLYLQQLPVLSNRPMTTFSNGIDSYLAPPSSSFSSFGPYPSSRRPLYLADPPRNQFKLTNNNGNRNVPKLIYPRNRGSIRSQLKFPVAPLIGNLIPPRSSPLVNFHQTIQPQLPSKSIYNSYPSPPLSSSSASALSSVASNIYDGSSYNNNKYQYSPNFDSHGSSSSSYHKLSNFPTSNQLKFDGSTEQIDGGKTNHKFEIKVNDDTKSMAADAFDNFHHENGAAAQALAQALTSTSEDVSSDGLQIQGSKDSYILQIESSNGGQQMENSDGTIKHDQILSERLLHDIISAIEEPGDRGNVKILTNPPIQSLDEIHEHSAVLPSISSSRYSSFFKDDSEQAASQLDEKSIDATSTNHEKETESSPNENETALFFDNRYEESINKIASTFNDENLVDVSSAKNNETRTNL